MTKKCERCGAARPTPTARAFELLDYCAACGRDLCDKCMAQGCCGNTPARSGQQEDYGDELEGAQS